MHEEPHVPNYGEAGRGGACPPAWWSPSSRWSTPGRPEVVVKDDGWTAVTKDGSLSAHFEHSVAITEDGPVVLSRS